MARSAAVAEFRGDSPPQLSAAGARRRAVAALESGIALAVALAMLWPLLVLGGVPLRHDWVWPATRDAASTLLAFGFSPWSPQNLGSPNVYPADAPLRALMWALCRAFGVRAALDVVLVALALATYWGARRLARELDLPPPFAWAAGALYVAMPAFCAELIAGHLGDLVAYAALPWLVSSAFRYSAARDERELGIGLVAALAAAVQVQYLVLDAVALAGLALCIRTRRALLFAAIVTAGLAAANAPTIYGIVHSEANVPLLNHEQATLQWEESQSSQLALAAHAGGYTAEYDLSFFDRLGVLAAPLRLVVGLSPVALATLLFVRQRRIAAWLLASYVFGLCVLAGLHGPAQAAIAWLFLNVKAMSLMRELFHAAPFVALPLSIAIAVACRELAGPSRSWASARVRGAASVLTLVGVAYAAGPASGIASTWIAGVRVGPLLRSELALDAADRVPGRLVVFPGRMPERLLGTNVTGVDPRAYYPNGAHRQMFEYFPSGVESLASDLLNRGDTAAAERLYARMSVRRVIFRSDVEFAWDDAVGSGGLALAKAPPHARGLDRVDALAARPLVFGGGLPLVAGGDFARLAEAGAAGSIFAFARLRPPFVAAGLPYRTEPMAPEDAALARGCATLETLPASRRSADPGDAWVDGFRFGPFDPRADDALVDSVVTQDRRAVAQAFASHRPVLAEVIDGKRGAGFAWMREAPDLRAGEALVVAGRLARSASGCPALRAAPDAGRIERVAVTSQSPASVAGTFVATGAGTLGFTDAFDRDWRLSVDGIAVGDERHFPLDGFGNGWLLELPPGTHRYAIAYGAPALWTAALWSQALTWFAALALATLAAFGFARARVAA